MDRTRLLELAIAELQRQKDGIDAEIAAIRAELGGTGAALRRTEPATSPAQRGRTRTAAQRKAQSQKMRQIWAARRARAAKPAPAAKMKEQKAEMKGEGAKKAKSAGKPKPTVKARIRTDAEKKVQSEKMKEIWKKRKEAATKK